MDDGPRPAGGVSDRPFRSVAWQILRILLLGTLLGLLLFGLYIGAALVGL